MPPPKFAGTGHFTGQLWLSFTVQDFVPAFRVKLSVNELNSVDVPLNPTHSLLPVTQRTVSKKGLAYLLPLKV